MNNTYIGHKVVQSSMADIDKYIHHNPRRSLLYK